MGYSALWIALLASVSFFSFVISQSNLSGVSNKPFALGAGLVLGPASTAWSIWLLMAAFPRFSPLAYLTAIALIWTILTVAIIRKVDGRWMQSAVESLGRFRSSWNLLSMSWKLVAGSIGIVTLSLIGVTVYLTFSQPLIASDPLEYHAVTREIAEARSLDVYPIKVPSEKNGLYARSAHPPGFHMLIVANYFAQVGGDSNLMFRVIQAAIFLGTMLMISAAAAFTSGGAPRGRFLSSLVTLTFAVSVSFYLTLVTELHVDPLRIGTLTAAFFLIVALTGYINEGGTRPLPLVLVGFCLGISFFSHSIGLLNLFICGLIYMLFTRTSVMRYFAYGAALFAISVAVGGYQYVENLILFGVPIHDAEPVWDLPNIDHAADVRYRRGMTTFEDRLLNGALVWLTKPSLYGYSHWVLLVGMLFLARLRTERPAVKAAALYLLAFYSIVAVTMAVGADLIIKNIRYMLTIMPFVVLISGQLATRGLEKALAALARKPS